MICNTCEQMNVLGDIFNAGWNVFYQEDYVFKGSFYKVYPTVIYDITTKKFMNNKRTPMFNNDEQQFNHPICENIEIKEDEKEDPLTSE